MTAAELGSMVCSLFLAAGVFFLLIWIIHEHFVVELSAEAIEAAAPLAIFGLLHSIFNEYLWNTPLGWLIFVLARSSKPPNISGSYNGKMECYEPEVSPQRNDYDADVTINQNWERMSVRFRFPRGPLWMKNPRSYSEMSLLTGNENSAELSFKYRHERVLDHTTGVTRREILGFTDLKFERIGGKWVANGTYYSEDRGSGAITLEQTP